jgi:hypothetical protein
MKFTSKQDIIAYMISKPKHKFKSPSELRRKNTIYAELTNDEINAYKNEAYSTSEIEIPKSPKVVESDTTKDRSTITISSPTPLNPKQIEELVGADNINVFVDRVWIKSQKDDIWTYSILTVNKVSNFYSKDELKEKLKELLPDNIKQTTLPKVKHTTDDNLIIYVSDIHAGAINSSLNTHKVEFNKDILIERLLKVANAAINRGVVYKKVYIVNLGDSLDGYDGYTVSRRHSLGSASNKDQFDIFIDAMSTFYNTILNSGISSDFTILNCLNSNHDGSGFSYIGNKAVELYLSAKYPDVKFIQQEEFINIVDINSHKFAFTHGKDAHYMKFPMKKYVDEKLDSWMQQYFQTNNINTANSYCHLRRGDLHMYVSEFCKFGDSIMIPSVYGCSDYISINYGNTLPGALLEVVSDKQRGTNVEPIWL